MNVLGLFAHPDDECLGAGGTLAKLGHDSRILLAFLGQGACIQGEYPQLDIAEKLWEPPPIICRETADQRFEATPLRDLADFAHAQLLRQTDIVITHSLSDLNRDHQLTAEATLIACRRASVSLILGCQGDRHIRSFVPTYFVDITDHWKAKVTMLEAYRKFLLPYPDPRSIEGQEARARYWGTVAGIEMAEAFEVLREVR